MSNQSLGFRGEELAAKALVRKGFRIVARNFRAQRGELDVVALDGDTLVFVEVKTRVGHRYGLPEDAVTPKKLREIAKTGQYFASKHPGLPECFRIDVVAVDMDNDGNTIDIRHLPSVTS